MYFLNKLSCLNIKNSPPIEFELAKSLQLNYLDENLELALNI